MAKPTDHQVISYLTLRKVVGWIGILLPAFVIVVDQVFGEAELKGSVSAYYHTVARDYFVAGMCATALFLVAYVGRDRLDNWSATIAGICAFGVAFVPTTPEEPTDQEKIIGVIHVIFAGSMFLALAVIAIFVLTRRTTAQPADRERQRRRDKISRVCGAVMGVCMLLIAVGWILGDNNPAKDQQPVLWLEAIATMAFGVSWLVKGRGLPWLGDRVPPAGAEPGAASPRPMAA